MKCLKCKKEFEAKKPTRKFCSDSCRVMYNFKKRKESGVKVISSTQAQVLYNAMLDLVSKINYKDTTPDSYDGNRNNKGVFDEPTFTKRTKIKRSYENYQQLKLDCENIEDWNELRTEILNSDLSTKEKALLTS